MDLRTERLFRLDFVNEPNVDVVADMVLREQARAARGWRCVVTPNVDHLVRYEREPAEVEAALAATTVLPDGAPIIWASRLLGRPLTARLTGADLFATLLQRIVAESIPTVVIAPTTEVADAMDRTHALSRSIVAPVLDIRDESGIERLAAEATVAVAEIGAQFLVVAVSMPKHHRIANALRHRWSQVDPSLPTPTVLLVGAAPEFALGLTTRAPRWMQRSGVEWLHRLIGDPRRLAKRYLVDDVRFLQLVWREWRSRGDSKTAK